MKRIDRYLAKIDDSAGPQGCWPWLACKNYRGYGLFWDGERLRIATRWGWETHFGPIPDGMFVCHTCDRPSCMNPNHWFLGSHADNMADCVAKGRQAKGDRNGMALHPERRATGRRNGTWTHPERRPAGDRHYARTRPERLPRGVGHGMAVLTDAIVRDIRQRHAAGVRSGVLAGEYGVSPSTVRRIVARQTWKHVMP